MSLGQKLKDVLKWVKDSSAEAVIRFFNSRTKKYDDLLARMSSMEEALSAETTVIDVSGDTGRKTNPKGRSGKSDTIRTANGTRVPIDKFVVPDREKLAKDVKLLDEAEHMIQELGAMITQVSTKRSVAAKKALKSMNEYMLALEEQASDLYEKVASLAEKHKPEVVEEMTGALFRYINDNISAELYDDLVYEEFITSSGDVVGKKNGPIEFHYFLHIEGLEKELFGSGTFILALTVVISAQGRSRSKYQAEFYLTSLEERQQPGHFDKGTRISGTSVKAMKADLGRVANKLLSMHSLGPVFGRRKIKITQAALRNSGLTDLDGVIDVDVDDEGAVLVEVSGSLPRASIDGELIKDIITHIRRLARIPKKSTFTYDIKAARGRYQVIRVVNVATS